MPVAYEEAVQLIEESVNERTLAGVWEEIDKTLNNRIKLEEAISPVYHGSENETGSEYKDGTHAVSLYFKEQLNQAEKTKLIEIYKQVGWPHVAVEEIPAAHRSTTTNHKTRVTLYFSHEFKNPAIRKGIS